MDGATLVINGRNYTSKTLHLLPLDINGYSATSKEDTENNIIGFFGELNPLSNFHPAKFNINGNTYHSSEQFIQQQKSVLFGDTEAERQIMNSESPVECKIIARNINNYDHERWKQNIKATCTPGLLAKFEQNPTLAKLLLSTGNKTLVESSKDKKLGNRRTAVRNERPRQNTVARAGILRRNARNSEKHSQKANITCPSSNS